MPPTHNKQYKKGDLILHGYADYFQLAIIIDVHKTFVVAESAIDNIYCFYKSTAVLMFDQFYMIERGAFS